MDNAQKAIMIGVGLFIAIVIISAVLLITNMGSSGIKKSTSDIAVMTEEMQNQLIKDYDGKILGSTETLELIKKYYSGKDGVSLTFSNGGPTAHIGAKYISVTGTIGNKKAVRSPFASWINNYNTSTYLKTPLSDFTTSDNLFYIAPGSKYKTSIVYNLRYTGVIGIAILKAT